MSIRLDRAPPLAAELVALKLDVILANWVSQVEAVRTATKFDVVINLRTADALGLSIPTFVLQEASELIR